MKITAPLRLSTEAEQLIDAGARELYLGLAPGKWSRKYGFVGSPNRRYFKESSVKYFSELKETANIAHSKKARVFLAVNSPYYIKPQKKLVMEQFKKGIKAEVDAFIIADISAMLLLKKIDPDAQFHVSGVATVFNSSSSLFYRELGAKRIILPRHLRIDEIREIVKGAPGIEYETFILYDWCKNVDGFCTFHHGIEELLGAEHGCTFLNNYNLTGSSTGDEKRTINQKLRRIPFPMYCAACAIYHLQNIGITSVKIAGRRFPIDMKLSGVNFISTCIRLAEKSSSRQGYIEKAMELFSEYFNRRCPRQNCNVLMI